MKPFDLERAKAGAKLATRNGRGARFIAHEPGCAYDHRVLALIDGDTAVSAFTEGGAYFTDTETNADLFISPETRTLYVNLFPGGHADWFDTEAEARAGLNARALKIAVPVTFEV
jgi:hypothetical protein